MADHSPRSNDPPPLSPGALGTDGLPEEAAPSDGDSWFFCEYCHRCFPDDASRQVGLSGSEVSCIHCAFNSDLTVSATMSSSELADEVEALEAMEDVAGAVIGGLRGYLGRCLPHHAFERCPWGGAEACYLCKAHSAGVTLGDTGTVDRWITSLMVGARPPSLKAGDLARWNQLPPEERSTLGGRVLSELDEAHGAGVFRLREGDAGEPSFVHRASGVELLLIPGAGRTQRPFLLARRLLSRAEASGLGLSPTAAADDATPLTGFDLHALPGLFKGRCFRLPTADELVLASEGVSRDQGILALVEVRRDEIAAAGGGSPPARGRSSVLQRFAITPLDQLDAIGRRPPVHVPAHVGLRLAVTLFAG